MNVFAKFDEIPSMILKDVKETKRYGQTVVCSDSQTDNVKTVYPPTNTVCGGYKYRKQGIGNNIYTLKMVCLCFMSHQQLQSYREGT